MVKILPVTGCGAGSTPVRTAKFKLGAWADGRTRLFWEQDYCADSISAT